MLPLPKSRDVIPVEIFIVYVETKIFAKRIGVLCSVLLDWHWGYLDSAANFSQ